ncbi:MAG: hypothetical protein A2Y73_04840 [Chloroflexi bacterium RBG_13_56_8]|nr:MAG: hypothetical protein A2Y73_04840 [Chloroflexi bacterium RBG_13_56_8]
MDVFLQVFQVILIGVLLTVVIVFLLRRSRDGAELGGPYQSLVQAIHQLESQTGILGERVGQVSERVASVEHNHDQVSQRIAALRTELAQTGTATQNLVQTADAIRSDLSRAGESLTELRAQAKARREIEERSADSIQRLETIIAGTQTKGLAGENILDVILGKLPPDWQVRNFRVGDKVVEFGLRLPNNLVLPIDSKWPATRLLEEFASSDDPSEQQNLKSQIESTLLAKAKEVRKYIDPNVTVSFALAVVPDAAYDLCSGVQIEAGKLNVVLIGYSMFVPYLLLVFQTILKSSQSINLQKLDAYLQSAEDCVRALQEELGGRFSRAITMLSNSRDSMNGHLSRVMTGLTSLQLYAEAPSRTALLGEGQATYQSEEPSESLSNDEDLEAAILETEDELS